MKTNTDLLKLMVLAALAPGLAGCVHTRVYLADKERVDQEISGLPPAEKKTRKVVVVEMVRDGRESFGQANPGPEVAPADSQPTAHSSADISSAAAAAIPPESRFDHFDASARGSDVPVVEAETGLTPAASDYLVQKDDTLQKIAKKVYGSYSRWPHIYEANRSLIKNPNSLKPGIVLRIPVLNTDPSGTGKP